MKSTLYFFSFLFAFFNSTLALCADEVTPQNREISVINTTPAFWQFWDTA